MYMDMINKNLCTVYTYNELCSARNDCVFNKEVVWCVGIAVILRGVGRV
jgi:hypothetical protein